MLSERWGVEKSVDISNKWELGGRVRERERESSFTWGDSRAGHVPAPCDAASRFGRCCLWRDGVERCAWSECGVGRDIKHHRGAGEY
jgi:hypothetical protein